MKSLGQSWRQSVSGLTLIAIVFGASWLGGMSADDRISVPEQRDAHAGSYVVVPVTAVSEFGIDSVAFRMGYSAKWLIPVGVYKTPATRDFDLRFEIETPGQLVIELSGHRPLFGSTDVAWILFSNTGTVGDEAAPLTLGDVVLNGSEETTLEHGWLELGAGQTTLSLPADLADAPGATVTAALLADPADGILALDIFIQFDSTVLQFVGVSATPFTSGFSATPNLINPDQVIVSLFGTVPLSGTGPLLDLDFTVVGLEGQSTPLDVVSVSINEGAIEATLVDGFFVVCDDSDSDNDGFSLCDLDCDDDDELSFPGNPEVGCDRRDNDCDPGTPDLLDADGDEFVCDVDCDDIDPAINPDASEVCDDADNDCDNDVDEDAAGAPLAQPTMCGVGSCAGNTGQETCVAGSYGNDTCDPFNGATLEICDGLDNDCDAFIDNLPVPTELVAVVGEGSATTTFSWSTVSGATGYDVVRGVLSDLIATGGDFSVATDACLADATPPTSINDSDSPPLLHGFWYMVRAVNCGGDGTYDSGGAEQAGQRDVETNASPNACP